MHEAVKEVSLFTQMKPDAKGIRKGLSVKARQTRLFSKRLYQELRGVVETMFWGATDAGLMLTFVKKEHTRRLDTLILAVRHNLTATIR